MSKKMYIVIAGGLTAAIVAFLLFRPDKLFVDDVVDESLADAFATAPPPTEASTPATVSVTSTSTTTAPEPTMPEPTVSPATTTAPSEPTVLSNGSFFGIDHQASGTASIYVQDGRYVLRFEEDTDIQNGPDLYVWVTTGTDWDDPGEHIDLGTLEGNVGGQNYELPPEFDPDVHRNVLIWCLRFQVPFAAAELG